METISTITKEQLLENGWKICDSHASPYLMIKELTTEGEDGDPDEGQINLILHRFYNEPLFALTTSDGMLNINPSSIEDLILFEKLIVSYEPNF